jgi:rubredoxin
MSASGSRQWQCYFCAHVYDEAAGMPEHGIAPGTPWEAVPDDWFCPECGAGKADFALLEMN